MKGQDDYIDLTAYIERFDISMRVSDDEFEKRLAICKECSHLVSGTCLKCGCYVELRAAIKKNHCADTPRRWQQKGCNMSIPNDPMMLLSFVNLKLRDFYSSFDAMCEDMELNKDEIIAKLASIDYEYDAELNKFC